MRRQPPGASAEGPRPVPQARATPLSWIARLKAGVASSLQVAAECGVGLLSLAGVPVMVFTGKLFAAAVLAVIALGVFLRVRGAAGNARVGRHTACTAVAVCGGGPAHGA